MDFRQRRPRKPHGAAGNARSSRHARGREDEGTVMSAGHIRRRGKNSWELKFDVGADPLSGKRRLRYASFKGSKRDAALELARLVAEHASGAGVDPSKA